MRTWNFQRYEDIREQIKLGKKRKTTNTVGNLFNIITRQVYVCCLWFLCGNSALRDTHYIVFLVDNIVEVFLKSSVCWDIINNHSWQDCQIDQKFHSIYSIYFISFSEILVFLLIYGLVGLGWLLLLLYFVRLPEKMSHIS